MDGRRPLPKRTCPGAVPQSSEVSVAVRPSHPRRVIIPGRHRELLVCELPFRLATEIRRRDQRRSDPLRLNLIVTGCPNNRERGLAPNDDADEASAFRRTDLDRAPVILHAMAQGENKR